MRTTALLMLLVLLAPVSAQEPDPPSVPEYPFQNAFNFELEVPNPNIIVDVNENGVIPFTFRDLSKDGPNSYTPDGTQPLPGVFAHQVDFDPQPLTDDPGWIAFKPPGAFTQGGDVYEGELVIQASPQARDPFFTVNFTVTILTPDGGTHQTSATIVAYSPGVAAFNAQVSGSYLIKPRTVVDVPVKITNTALVPKGFDIAVGDNPCDLFVQTTTNNIVGAKETTEYTVTFQAPEGKAWYFSELCSFSVQVFPTGNEDAAQTIIIGVQVNGGYLDPVWVFWGLALLAALIILLFFLAGRKRRLEEEILGKPQKPWLIPVEKVYLDRLKEEDERAWFVVRHYLMEDEYRSSLLWYANFKKATKNQRVKERLVVSHERAYERWRRGWQKKVDKPLRKADRFERKLQRKLDRKADQQTVKERKQWEKLTLKQRAAHEKQVAKANEAWEKEAKKARKRGQPEPEKPVLADPDLPERPGKVAIALEEHKWSRKADRRRGRMDRKNQRLQAKFDAADAKRRRKVMRKVKRAAKKLDDPEFVAEHPLLAESLSS